MNATNRRYCSHCSAAFVSSIDRCPRDGADLRSFESNPLIGQIFGDRYRLVERLGAGGMGEVYRAEHVTIGKSFAIKVLLGEVAADNNMVVRFRREAKALSLLGHRNIVSVADFGETNEGLLYLVTEFVDGTPLSHALQRRAFNIDRIIHVVRQIGKALSHAHRRGLVHRDLKPDNVMLVQGDDEPDIVKVLDFGIARVADAETTESLNRLTTQGIVMGTPAYISPEQALGQEIDHRADLYSLGVLLYELLAGQVPFRGKSPVEVMSKHLREEPPALVRDDLTRQFRALTMRLLEKDPNNRCKDAETFLDELESLEETRPSGTYVHLAPDAEESFPLRQGSATLLAPVAVDVDADTDAPVDAPATSGSTEPTATQSHRGRRVATLVLGMLVATALVVGVIYKSAERSEPRDDNRTTASRALALVAPPSTIVMQDADPGELHIAAEQAALPPALDAGPHEPSVDAATEPGPTKRSRDKPERNKRSRDKPERVLTQETLRTSLEQASSRLDTLAQGLDKSQVDPLRRQWLDLATALADIEESDEALHAFAARIRKLRTSIDEASGSK